MIIVNQTRDLSTAEWDDIVSRLGLSNKLINAKSIVIKPNFAAGTYVDPKTHVMSDLSLLKSCIEYIAEKNSKAIIYIAEADSTGYGFAYLKFERLGLPETLQLPPEAAQRVKLLDLTRDRLRRVEDPKLIYYTSIDKQLCLSETLLDADFRISLSNLKTHAVTGYTGACKNLFGCLPDFDKSHNHPHISKVVHDLVVALMPDLSVVDAFYGMEKNGPVQGVDVDSGYRVFSENPIEADVYAAGTIGYPPKKAGYLKKLCKSYGMSIQSDAVLIQQYSKPGMFLRVMNQVGLVIQGCGQGIELFGHRIHSCPTFLVLCITLARPILLKLFDYEKLKAWKRKILK